MTVNAHYRKNAVLLAEYRMNPCMEKM